MKDVATIIRSIIADKFDIDEIQVTRDTRFIEDFGADSLDLVELTLEFENEFKFPIPDEDDAESIKTVGEMIDYIEKTIIIYE
ncbi:MAG: acyl carrier protein [Bacteroidota bacterium]